MLQEKARYEECEYRHTSLTSVSLKIHRISPATTC